MATTSIISSVTRTAAAATSASSLSSTTRKAATAAATAASVATTTSSSLFSSATRIPPDPIFALTVAYQNDPSPLKVNLGQGTYRDENARPWVLNAVREARKSLADEGLLHEYLPILGHPGFRRSAAELVLGSNVFGRKEKQIATCQSISGTGALHLAGLLIRRCCNNNSSNPKHLPDVLIPDPTWSNHVQVFSSLGFTCKQFPYYDSSRQCMDFASYCQALQSTAPGSVVVLHACAHNPTGCDPSQEEWRQLGRIIKERNLFPLFDAAYLGFNSGSVDEDAWAIRYFVDELELEVGVCVSFAKNMGLYGERVGCTMIISASEEIALNTQSQLEQLQRSEVSNPPAYGAKIAHKILTDSNLRALWKEDLIVMSSRIKDMRRRLYDGLIEQDTPGPWTHLIRQSGMFGFLGLSKDIVDDLKENHHIYMADNSRVSIAGLNPGNVNYVAESIAKCLKKDKKSRAEE